MRAVAVLFVFFRHSWGLSGQPLVVVPLPFGGDIDLTPMVVMMANGVDLFFVLSGFLLARAFVDADLRGAPRPDLRRYVRSRAYRILPAYYFSLAGLFLFFAPQLLDPADVYSKAGAVTLGSHALVMQTINPVSYGRWGIASPYWTLTIEVLFYALVPFVAQFFFRRRVWIGLAASLAISVGWLWAARNHGSWLMDLIVDVSHREGAGEHFARFFVSKQIPGYAFSFGAGIAAASVAGRVRHRRRSGSPAPWWGTTAAGLASVAAGGVIVAASMMWLGRLTLAHRYYDGVLLMSDSSAPALRFYYLEATSMAVGFGLMVYGLVVAAGSRSTSPFRASPARLVGILGFAIYLWHMPLLYLYNRIEPIMVLPPGWHWWWLSLAAGASTVAVGVFSFFVVEKPFVQRGRSAGRPPADGG